MSKEYVAMAEHICPICSVQHTHNTEILIHKRLRNIPEDKRVTGMGLCAEHAKLHEDGFVCMIGGEVSDPTAAKVNPEDVIRSGRMVHVRRSVWENLFNIPLDPEYPYVFVEDQVISIIENMIANQNQEES